MMKHKKDSDYDRVIRTYGPVTGNVNVTSLWVHPIPSADNAVATVEVPRQKGKTTERLILGRLGMVKNFKLLDSVSKE
jgi:hypothetical protein